MMNKYPIWRFLSDARTWGVAILIGCILQGIALYLFSLKSVFLFTAVLFIAIVWFTVNRLVFLIKKFRKKQLEKSLLVVNSFFATWLIAEVLLRMWGGVATYSEHRMWHYESHYSQNKSDYWINKAHRKPEIELKNTEYNFKRVRNSAGYSDKEWVSADMNNKTIVLAIGDSFTEGDGAHADSTWMRFLERKFNSNKFYFMNAGLCGSDPVFDLYNLKNNLMHYKPHLVIACVNGSDIGDIIVRGGSERFLGSKVRFRQGPWWEFIYASSHMSRFVFSVFYNEYLIPHHKVENQRADALRIIFETIAEMKELCNSASIELLVVFHPFKGQVTARTNEFIPIIGLCENDNIAVANLFAFYDADSIWSDISRYYWLYDGHHNAQGYQLMADAIYLSLLQYFPKAFGTIEIPE